MKKRLNKMERERIEIQVKSVLEQFGYNDSIDSYVDIVSLVKNFGFLVGNAELDESEDGFLIITRDQKIIGVNKSRSLELKRFVIAHEFAHYILHFKQGQVFLHREHKKGKDMDENDADYFAAVLLMPKNAFLREYNRLKNQGVERNLICFQLSSLFKTPLESVARRIEETVSC